MITAVIPVLNDDDALRVLLKQLSQQAIKAVVVDAAASAATAKLVTKPNLYVQAPASRGAQIAKGIAVAQGREVANGISTAEATVSTGMEQWLWVLHADSKPSQAAIDWLMRHAELHKPSWGRFDVHIPRVPWVAQFMNWRSRLTKICTGDQGMFFHSTLIEAAGGFPQQPLMEDIEASIRLKAAAKSAFVAPTVLIETSPRRWLHNGWWKTVLRMWMYRWRYYWGADPQKLYCEYYGN